MGVVYLAEQEYPIHRRVALKVIKIGMETREVVARFEAERQALALMDHPCIAQMYDAGSTSEGRPYFAMEYVAGIPITNYCDRHRLPMASRLDLFVRVCGAIQHAHQKGVIHRDIKPSNILVTVEDGKPLPKVIDFGVAKATHQRLTERTLFTQHGVLIGTPAYMSPEQAEMGELGVDTTTDIYSLGVVLYELLIGALPFEPEMLRRAGYGEIQRIIREREPLRPSARLSSQYDTAMLVALRRQTKLPTLVRQLKGDLDWIALKAMAKERTRRYPSASELAADIERHLRTEPVSARPPSLTYRARKFLHKYRAAVVAVALGVTASTAISIVVQTRNVVAATSRAIIAEGALIQRFVLHHIMSTVSKNPTLQWTDAVANNEGLRDALDSAVFAQTVTGVAICDMGGRVVVASDPSIERCPAGQPISALASIDFLGVMRGTPRNVNYVASQALIRTSDGAEVGSIRVQLSGLFVAEEFYRALRLAAISCIGQVFLVVIVVTGASWFVFRRDYRLLSSS